jgi:hypothetical protein
MPRARNIKPSFFKNEILIELSFEARLLFIGLWTLADREGRLEDRPKRIKMEIFPADNVDVNLLLNDLNKAGFIKRYVLTPDQHQTSTGLENNTYIQIVNFTKHQSPHIKEAASIIPSPDQHQTSTSGAALIPDILNPESPFLKPDILNPDVLSAEAHTKDFKDLIFENDFVQIATEADLTGDNASRCWNKFKLYFDSKPPADPIAAWKKWVLDERKAPEAATKEAPPLEGADLLIHQVGIANWRRKNKMFIEADSQRKLDKWESEKGAVTWNHFDDYQKQQGATP